MGPRDALLSGDPARARGGQPGPDAVPARPRPDRALEGVPRLKHKTQVFIAPEGDHYRTRLTHTLEACGISRTVARALGLNEDLTEAIGLGHDLGHPPFGHIGRRCWTRRCARRRAPVPPQPHSLRMVDSLERDGQGLNLTQAVRDGILNHTGPAPGDARGPIVRLVDRVAYINHDIDDALRAGSSTPTTFRRPRSSPRRHGVQADRRPRVRHRVELARGRRHRAERGDRGRDAAPARLHVRARVPGTGGAKRARARQADRARAVRSLHGAPRDVPEGTPGTDLVQRVTDYLAGMTDRYCIAMFRRIALPRSRSYSAALSPETVESVKAAADMVEMSPHTPTCGARGSGSSACARSTRSARRRSRSTPGEALLLPAWGRRVPVPGKGGAVVPGGGRAAGGALRGGGGARARTRAPRRHGGGASGCASCSSGPRASTSFLWEAPKAQKAREYLARRG